MLFTSFDFIFLFLPITLAVFWFLTRVARGAVPVAWLVTASLVFYGASNPQALAILLASLAINYLAGLQLDSRRDGSMRDRKRVMVLAVSANLLILGQTKYFEFAAESVAALFGIDLPLARSIPPLAISFFTFQQIAYVVDVFRGDRPERNLLRYTLFVSFFPQLIAGPIVHHREMLPQFSRERARVTLENLVYGGTFFVFGLFKKVVVADGLVPWVAPAFDAAIAAPQSIGLIDAWGAALTYSFQLYFDFSGYCDMAIGLAALFGIRLPTNFDSPYKARSIIDFWSRWHQTLSRFLRDYLYILLGGNRKGSMRRYQNLMLTMLLGGLWHGASWTFVAWGALHGVYLMINHAWRVLGLRSGLALEPSAIRAGVYQSLTFAAVTIAWVFFRSGTFPAALSLLASMTGANGLQVADVLVSEEAGSAALHFGIGRFAVLAGLLSAVWGLPNSQEIMNFAGSRIREDSIDDRKEPPVGDLLLRWRAMLVGPV